MSRSQPIVCGLPFCNPGQQTKLSIGLRITAIVLGLLLAAVGVLIVTRLGHLSAAYGWSIFATGAAFVGLGISVKCIKNQSDTKNEEQAPSKNVSLIVEESAHDNVQAVATTIPINSALSTSRDNTIPLSQESAEQKAAKVAAAIIIQKRCRGHLVRVKTRKLQRNFLSYRLLEQAKPYINNPSSLEDLPRATSGGTRVYLPKELPIVLKESGSPENQKRFDQMGQGREICERSGYADLVIPKARVYANFIIESRLPITMHGTKKQIGLYIENRDLFTNVVKEFIGFLCQSSFYDITGGNNDPYSTLSKSPLGRYDNIALYLENGHGKIGLIDLEHFSPKCHRQQKEWCFFRCRDAVHLFPHHLDEIMNAAKQFDPEIEEYRKTLEIERDEALKRFQIVYEDHLNFIKEKNITLQNAAVFEKLGIGRTEQLKDAIEKKLRKKNTSIRFEGYLGNNPGTALASFNEKTFPKLMSATYKLIDTLLDFNMKSCENNKVSSTAELLAIRTIQFSYEHTEYEDFTKSLTSDLTMFDIKPRKIKQLLDLLLNTILKEFAKGREIAYYNPNFSYNTRCIFF